MKQYRMELKYFIMSPKIKVSSFMLGRELVN